MPSEVRMLLFINVLCLWGFDLLGGGNQSPDGLEPGEKPRRDDPDHSVGGDGDEHAENPSYMAGHQEDYEYLQRGGLYALGIYERLEEEVVNQLCHNEHRKQGGQRYPEAGIDSQSGSAAVFQNQSEDHSNGCSDPRSDIGDDVE